MKTLHLLSVAALAFTSLFAQGETNTLKNARVDYLTSAGDRVRSEYFTGTLSLRFEPYGDGTYIATVPNCPNVIAHVKFTGYGEEDYPATAETVAEEIEEYGIKAYDGTNSPAKAKRADEAVGEYTPGQRMMIYMDVPEGYTPQVVIRYALTEGIKEMPGKGLTETFAGGRYSNSGIDVWNSIYTLRMNEINPLPSWVNPRLRGENVYDEQPVAAPEHPNRYWYTFTMPNEPVTLDLTVHKQTIESLEGTALFAMNYAMVRTWQPMYPAQAFWQGETGLTYYLGELTGSDCYINFVADQAPVWTMLYKTEEGVLWSNDYVWHQPVWGYCYSIIGAANSLLEAIENQAIEPFPAAEAERLHFIKAQALTMRAHAYWRLLQVYAPRWEDSNGGAEPCVVLRTTLKEPRNKELASMAAVLGQCYADLDAAIAEFKAAGSVQRKYTYEANLPVAYGVYARVAALKHDWQTCRSMARMAREGKRIATDAEAFGGYMAYNDAEWLWAPTFDDDTNFVFGNWSTFHAAGSYGALYGGYTNTVNIDLYNQIPKGDSRRNWWFTADKLTDIEPDVFYNERVVDPVNGQLTIPFLIDAATEWMKQHKPDWCYAGEAYSADPDGSIITNGAQIKFWVDDVLGQDGRSQVPFMRATEMWLYEAEACAELGLEAEARQLLNEVNVPRNPEYSCQRSGKELIDEVRLYRRVELWGEGFCWFDLKRWNVPLVRRALVAGDPSSGNLPALVACDVPVTQNNGWRYGIPRTEYRYNNLIGSPIETPAEVPAAGSWRVKKQDMERLLPGNYSIIAGD